MKFLDKLTIDDLKSIILHESIESLRLALSFGSTYSYKSSDDMPTLYYNEYNGVESIHGLITDITRYLLLKSIEVPTTKVTLVIIPTPTEVEVKFNDEVSESKSIEVDKGSSVKYEVSKDNYVTQSDTVEMTDSKSIEVNLELVKRTFKITPTPEDAIVKINEQEVSEITVDHGTEVSWEVSSDGYDTQSGTEEVTEDIDKKISLNKTQVTLTVQTTPAEATVKFNDGDVDPDKSITVDKGSSVKYLVEADGYESKEDTIQVSENKSESVVLTKKQYDFTVNPTPSDATVTIGGEQVKTKKVDHGSNVSWSVSKDGYKEQSGTENSISGPVTKDITLEAIDVTLTLTCDEPGAEIKLGLSDDSLEVKDSIVSKFGTTVYYEVSAVGYNTDKGSIKLTESSGTQTKDITLTLTE